MSTDMRALALLGPLLILAACGGKVPPPAAPPPAAIAPPPPPAAAQLTVVVSSDVNPDANGRPSPVVVRLYQLSGDVAFNGAEFFSLFDEEQRTLAGELISRSELVLVPAEHRRVEFPVEPGARFVGIVAAFRDIRRTEWRAVVPAWTQGSRAMTVALERARVSATVADPPRAFASED